LTGGLIGGVIGLYRSPANCEKVSLMSRNILLALLAASMFSAAPAYAKIVAYSAELNGQSPTISTGSSARASARISVDTAKKTVAIRLNVIGLSVDALWDKLVKAPIGPIHLHQYASGNLADANSSELAFPLPYGSSYKATRDGFRVRTGVLDYAKAVAPLGQNISFEAFIAALEKGTVVLNIHTDAFNGGEINGLVVKAAS
jgi:CHRD domain